MTESAPEPHDARSTIANGLFGTGLLVLGGLTLRWVGAESVGALVVLASAGPIGWFLAQLLKPQLRR